MPARRRSYYFLLKSVKYFPYPSASNLSTGINRNDAEFMQYRAPSGPGPSSNRCPRCESASLDRTSVRDMPSVRSVFVITFAGSIGRVKLGHPVPESYLSSELNNGSPETTST